MPNTEVRRAVDLARWSHGLTMSLTSDWPEDKWTFQPAGQVNHALWCLGHLAATYEWGSGLIDGRPSALPETFAKCFNSGTKPHGNAGEYPKVADVRAACDKAFERFTAAAENLTEPKLTQSLKDSTGGFATDYIDLVHKLAWHDGWHGGQIAAIRKTLGLKSIMG